MESADLSWTGAPAPDMPDMPDLSNPTAVIEEIRSIENSTRLNTLRVGGLLSHTWRGGWFVSEEFPLKNLSTMSSWLMREYQIDLGPQDLRIRITPFETFMPYPVEVRRWIEPFAPSTAYQLARAARFMLPSDPLLMDELQISATLEEFIRPLMEICPYGVGVRDVFPKLWNAGLLPHGKGGKGGVSKDPKPDIGLLETLAMSKDGLVNGMFIPRRNARSNPKTELRWAQRFNDYCKRHDLDRDEAFRQIMELAETRLFADEEATV